MAWEPLEITEIDRVPQRHVSPVDGDCMAACIASLLRVPIGDVPTFHAQPDGTYPGYNWLSGRRLWFRYLYPQPDGTIRMEDGLTLESNGVPCPVLPGYAMASVPSELYPGSTHAIVVLDGVCAWDPSPHAADRKTPYAIRHYYQLVRTDD